MNVLWIANAWREYLEWHDSDPKMWARINSIVRDIQRDPFRGIGKPEPLKADMAGWWSRRIDDEHRLVYRVIGTGVDQRIHIIQCRLHYK
ncbi:MAG TPA: Txe/YoeB family addiction module toxin [Rhizomicrobium sp.]|jgi:toxin YoeB